MAVDTALKRIPLHDVHVALGAKIVPFAGFEMPVQYPSGITAEHKAVREKAGLFDVSHMGEFMVRGRQAVEFVNYVTTNDVSALAPGQAQYSTILREDGTIVDDCLVYRADDRVLMVVNGSNIEKDFAHISKYVGDFDATLEDLSDTIALLALQGPDAARILQQHTGTDLSKIKYYEFTTGTVAGVDKVYISRTGYTGEDGFELYIPAAHAREIWIALTASGDVIPVGLGARDSLRLEAGLPLYGHDLSPETDPVSAGLEFAISKARRQTGGFPGAERILKLLADGTPTRRVGLTLEGRMAARESAEVFAGEQQVGTVTSGGFSPTLGHPIAMAYVDTAHASEGTELELEVRGKRLSARVAPVPFVPHRYHRKGAA
ncbi:MAG: glycine cleavage system aminomethyltransferase GcvT [Gemmatimonadaceae bacterium]